MKKILFPILSIGGMLCLIPTISSCASPGGEEEHIWRLSFIANNTSMTTPTRFEMRLVWSMPDDYYELDLDFSSISFKYDNGTKFAQFKKTKPDAEHDNMIWFVFVTNSPITQNVTDGELSFHYKDNVSSREDNITCKRCFINHQSPLRFFVQKYTYMVSDTICYLDLYWQPMISYSFVFSPLSFKYGDNKEATLKLASPSNPSSQKFEITFSEKIDTIIDDGVLSFHYANEDEYISNDGQVTGFDILPPI